MHFKKTYILYTLCFLFQNQSILAHESIPNRISQASLATAALSAGTMTAIAIPFLMKSFIDTHDNFVKYASTIAITTGLSALLLTLGTTMMKHAWQGKSLKSKNYKKLAKIFFNGGLLGFFSTAALAVHSNFSHKKSLDDQILYYLLQTIPVSLAAASASQIVDGLIQMNELDQNS